MSGGSLNYVSYSVEDVSVEILRRSRDPLHIAFAKHVHKVAEALHELEWMFSGDTSPGAEVEAIRAVLHPMDEVVSATEEAKIALENLKQAIKNAPKK